MEKRRLIETSRLRKLDSRGLGSWQKDALIREEPLSVLWRSIEGSERSFASTMRTPGQDFELVAGMLFAEGLVLNRSELKTMSFCNKGQKNPLNRIKAILELSCKEIEARHSSVPSSLLAQSSCGLCSQTEIDQEEKLLARARSRFLGLPWQPSWSLLQTARLILNEQSPAFRKTGASHACLVVDEHGAILALAEDVGRHNACDKAIGTIFLASAFSKSRPFQLPAKSGIIFSSRLSFELTCKAVVAGAAWIASLSAPTHLAVKLAQQCQLPTFAFLGEQRCNRYQ